MMHENTKFKAQSDIKFKILQNLIASMKDRGIKLIMDFVPNHSSNEHEWFKKSELKEAPYTDFYIWRSAPNNWVGIWRL